MRDFETMNEKPKIRMKFNLTCSLASTSVKIGIILKILKTINFNHYRIAKIENKRGRYSSNEKYLHAKIL